MLYYYYAEDNPIDSAMIRYWFKELDDRISRLSIEENNAIFSLTVGLCAAYERQAFLEEGTYGHAPV